MLLTVFLLSLLVLATLSALHEVAITFRFLSPRLLDPGMTGLRHVSTSVILNALTFAIACSTYYSFCGNAAAAGGAGDRHSPPDFFRSAVCGKWLHPVSAVRHPAFSAWVIYGEAAGNASSSPPSAGEASTQSSAAPVVLEVDYPLDGLGALAVPATQVISPVFTTWLTLFALFLANCFADYAAVGFQRHLIDVHQVGRLRLRKQACPKQGGP